MPLLKIKDLKTWYPVKGSLLGKRQYLRAVDGVSFELNKGETVGLVGESGCGKSTLGRTLIRLENPHSGSVIIDNVDIGNAQGRELRNERRKFQMIFQDPYGSLNPRMSIQRVLDEVLTIHTKMNKSERMERMSELMETVGLRREHLFRYPHQFSGGQRQRIGIARALAVEPKVIIADEPVSALDVSVQAQIINLLMEIQRKTQITYLFIAHDLAVVEHISQRIMVMYLGKIVESGLSSEVCSSPAHPYTKALISAVPSLEVDKNSKRIVLTGDVPSPLNPPSACPFHPRCPIASNECSERTPNLTGFSPSKTHLSACHYAEKVFSGEV